MEYLQIVMDIVACEIAEGQRRSAEDEALLVRFGDGV